MTVFTPKGWEFSARGNALGSRQPTPPARRAGTEPVAALQAAKSTRPIPRAAPWAEDSQPFGLKTGSLSNCHVNSSGSLPPPSALIASLRSSGIAGSGSSRTRIWPSSPRQVMVFTLPKFFVSLAG